MIMVRVIYVMSGVERIVFPPRVATVRMPIMMALSLLAAHQRQVRVQLFISTPPL